MYIYHMWEALLPSPLEECPFSSSVGGTRFASFKNENRLSKCRFTVARLPYMTLHPFFNRLLSEKLEHFRAGRSQYYAIIHSVNKSF